MKLKEMVEEAVQSGIAPIVFDYQKVELFQEGKHAVRTFMVLNSLDLGTLTYKEYRYVARRTRQGNHMVRRHIDKLIRIIPMLLEEDEKIECFTIPVYARLLKDGELVTSGGRVLGVVGTAENLSEAIKKSYDSVSKIHFENAYYRHDIGARAIACFGKGE